LPEQRNIGKGKIGATAGILAPTLAFTCILIAIASYPQFSWTSNALSDLGVISGITGIVFNFGLCATGFLGLIFASLGLFDYMGKGWVGKIGVIVFVVATLALVAIGVFTESFRGIHYIVSVAFFGLTPISIFIITCAFLLAHQTKMAVFTVLVGVAAALPWLLQFTFNYVPNVAVPEFLSGFAVSIWTISISLKILKHSETD
jgi:hypothetical membrane protein